MNFMVYKDCKFYGPYSSKKDNRLRCMLMHPNGRKQTLSYPKYLMEIHLDKYLEEDDTIDHIDGNFLNNEISNLRVIKRKQHCFEDAIRNRDVIAVCNYCGKTFTISGSKLYNRNRRDRKQSGYYCSKQCSGKYGREVQLGLIKPTISDKIVPDTYKVKSVQMETSDIEAG